MIAAGVHHDADEPGGEPGFTLEAADLLHQRAADVLGDVLCVRTRPGHPPRDAVDAVVVSPQQRFERITVAARRAIDEVAIGVRDGLRDTTGAGRRARALRGGLVRPRLDRWAVACLQGWSCRSSRRLSREKAYFLVHSPIRRGCRNNPWQENGFFFRRQQAGLFPLARQIGPDRRSRTARWRREYAHQSEDCRQGYG